MKDSLNQAGFLSERELVRIVNYIKPLKNGCWNWISGKDRDGYGIFYFRRKNRRAHRVTWYAIHGVIGRGFVIDHNCRNRTCVNPAHLRKITPSQNALENTNSIAALNRQKVVCLRGHPFDKKYGNQRYCSVCQNEKTKRLRKKWKENPLLEGV